MKNVPFKAVRDLLDYYLQTFTDKVKEHEKYFKDKIIFCYSK